MNIYRVGNQENLKPYISVEIVSIEMPAIELVSDMIFKVISNLEYYNDWARTNELEKYSSANLLKYIENDSNLVLIAKISSDLVGFCISRYDDGLIWISWIGVKEAFRGKGVGKKLLDALENYVLHRGIHKIWCDSVTNNISAHNTFQKAGYEKVTTLYNHWYGQDFFIWQKSLIEPSQ